MRHLFFILAFFFFACSGNENRSAVTDTTVVKETEILFGTTAKSTDTAHSRSVDSTITPTAYHWTKLVDSAPWKKSYNFQIFSFRDTLWTFHHDGTWFSTNGTGWTKSPLPNAIYNLAFLDYIIYKDAIYGLGHFEGNIEQFSFRPDIYVTYDMKHWDKISVNSNLPKRFFYHPFVFDNKIWIIGGEDKQNVYADIWNSADGIHWNKLKDHAEFGKQGGAQFVHFKGRMYMLSNEVWSLPDGLNWQKETHEIVKGEKVFGYAPMVLDNKIWLLGCNRNGQFTSQVLVSEDGKIWKGMNAPWSPRGGIAATVHKGKIYMTGGKYGGTPNMPDFRYSNDVWVLSK